MPAVCLMTWARPSVVTKLLISTSATELVGWVSGRYVFEGQGGHPEVEVLELDEDEDHAGPDFESASEFVFEQAEQHAEDRRAEHLQNAQPQQPSVRRHPPLELHVGVLEAHADAADDQDCEETDFYDGLDKLVVGVRLDGRELDLPDLLSVRLGVERKEKPVVRDDFEVLREEPRSEDRVFLVVYVQRLCGRVRYHFVVRGQVRHQVVARVAVVFSERLLVHCCRETRPVGVVFDSRSATAYNLQAASGSPQNPPTISVYFICTWSSLK